MDTQKSTFEIKDKFYLNGEPYQIISGGMHYFRVLPEYWEDRLRKMKALGCNTVETYIPWNMHEPKKGEFDFYGRQHPGMLDIAAFVKTAQELGLYVILRPSPYICAEWDFGGLPAWLLTEPEMELRTSDPAYLRHVRDYYEKLMPVLAPLQVDCGGPVIMMQVENEYGSYGNDKKYLEALRDMMREMGITVPLFASDGPCDSMLSNTKIEGVFPTVNFGSRTKQAFEMVKKYNDGGPCMCTEFWIGWFDAWHNEKRLVGDTAVVAEELEEMLQTGNTNFYMFHGGTNFGFMNGSNFGDHLTPDVTSYDYGAFLTEDGQITEKYRAVREVIKKYSKKDAEELAAEDAEIERLAALSCHRRYGRVCVQEKVSLNHALEDLAVPVSSVSPKSMEALGQDYGYILYRTTLETEKELGSIRFYNTADRAIVYANGKKILTAEDLELLETHEVGPVYGENIRLDILVENMGRVNYGPRLRWQRKGIDGCVVINFYSQSNWQQYCLPMDNLEKLDYSKGYEEGKPAFYRFTWEADEVGDTFLDFDGWGKGCAFVNGFNIGRFWEEGPQKRLYVPGALLKEGQNEIILFESEGKCSDSIVLMEEPDLGKI